MLIVEGPDGAGKTTLIDQLVSEIGLSRMPRFSSSKDGPHKDLVRLVNKDLLVEPKAHQIYDRHPLISEPIYGPLVRETSQWGWDEDWWFRYAWRDFINKKPFFIFCMPPYETIKQNVDNPDMVQIDGIQPALPGVYWSYFFLMLRLQGQTNWAFCYDYTNSRGVDEYARLQWNIAQYWKERGWWHP